MLLRVSALLVGIGPLALGAHLAQSPSQPGERFWPQWRGPHATGVSTTATPPVQWSDTKNIRWKIEIPGRGSSSPIVWGDRVYVLSAVPAEVPIDQSHTPRGASPSKHRFVVLAIDRKTGKVMWERTAREEAPHEAAHPQNGSWASASPITNGEILIAPFESRGLYAYAMDGTLLWQSDPGDKRMRNQFGEGSTPALFRNRLVVVWDHTSGSFITVLDARTGKEIWRQTRDEIDSWATPLVFEHDGRAQVIVPGMNRVRSYDLETGEIIWQTAGLTMNPIPSPVADGALVYLMSGFRGNSLKAIRIAGAEGDITGTDAIQWTLDRDTPYVPSPLLYGGILYFLKSNNGILSAFDARTGKPHFQLQRLPSIPDVFASPVGAAGRIYITSRDGTTVVLKHGPTLETVAENKLSDGFDASPALVEREIYMRGYKYLYSIGE